MQSQVCLAVGDLYSHSTFWGYGETDCRGDEVEDWQIYSNMPLFNTICTHLTLRRLYTGRVGHLLEYGMIVWFNFDRVSKAQNWATRIIIGAMKSTPILGLETITGLQSLADYWDNKLLTQAAKFKTNIWGRDSPSQQRKDWRGGVSSTRVERLNDDMRTAWRTYDMLPPSLRRLEFPSDQQEETSHDKIWHKRKLYLKNFPILIQISTITQQRTYIQLRTEGLPLPCTALWPFCGSLNVSSTFQKHNTRPAYPKILLSLVSALQTACVCIFWFLTGLFCGCTTNQPKQKSVKGQFFCHSSCKKSAWTHIFNHTDALQDWHTDTRMPLFCLHLLKSFWIKACRTLSAKAMHHVCSFCWGRQVLYWTVVWSELVSLVSCILPLLWFCAATCHKQLWIQTLHIWRWLTFTKFSLQSQCSLV